MTTVYMIIENHLALRTVSPTETRWGDELQPLDGEFVTREKLFRKLPYAGYDARIASFDLGEFIRDGRTAITDETEELVIAWWGTLNRTDREEMAERGQGQIASRWLPDEYAAASAASEAV